MDPHPEGQALWQMKLRVEVEHGIELGMLSKSADPNKVTWQSTTYHCILNEVGTGPNVAHSRSGGLGVSFGLFCDAMQFIHLSARSWRKSEPSPSLTSTRMIKEFLSGAFMCVIPLPLYVYLYLYLYLPLSLSLSLPPSLPPSLSRDTITSHSRILTNIVTGLDTASSLESMGQRLTRLPHVHIHKNLACVLMPVSPTDWPQARRHMFHAVTLR